MYNLKILLPAASLTLSRLFLSPIQCVNKWSLFNRVSLWSVLVLGW